VVLRVDCGIKYLCYNCFRVGQYTLAASLISECLYTIKTVTMVGAYQVRTDAKITVTGASYCYLLFIDAMKVAVCPRVVTNRFIDIQCNDRISLQRFWFSR